VRSAFLVLIASSWAAAAQPEPLDLTACVRRALAANPEVQDALDATASANLGRRVALAEYHLKVVPSVNGGIQGRNETDQDYNLLFSRKFLPTGTRVAVQGGTHVFSTVPQVSVPYFSETRLSVAQPVLQGRTRLENRERIDDAERRIASSENAVAVAREDLALRVVERFYDVVRATRLTEVGEQSLARVRGLGEMAEGKLSLGAVSKMDVYRTELHASRLENTLVDQHTRREAALDDLKKLLALDPRVELAIDARVQGPAATDFVGESAIDNALTRRTEVVEARQRVSDLERKTVLARYRLWPAFDLVGFYARQGLGNSFGSTLELDREEWNVGVRSTVSLDRTVEEAALADAEIALRREERQYRVVSDAVVAEVRRALRELQRAKAEVTLAGQIAQQADQQAELARFRYDKGVTDNFDLVQAEEQRAEAQASQAIALINEAVAAAVVRRASGTLAEAFGAVPPSPAPALPDEQRPGRPVAPGENCHGTR
jgi:outer membrane protein TolC